uniref:Putative HNH endonuclease n=1 Tax=viral metagenome TaxID=1070528 RepID=A0A6M3L6X0_9ZZZZ
MQTREKPKKFWLGSEPKCDFCGRTSMKKFIDGATAVGPWAMMCVACFNIYGRGLGLGKGQLYQKQKDSSWLKIGG